MYKKYNTMIKLTGILNKKKNDKSMYKKFKSYDYDEETYNNTLNFQEILLKEFEKKKSK